MKIILKEDVQGLGYKDDVLTVKSGYGRNFLIPTGKAVLATESAQKVFEIANEMYKKGEYENAIQKYEFIEKSLKQESADLYFNLGNSYYKLNKVAPSIYYYEKALLLTGTPS